MTKKRKRQFHCQTCGFPCEIYKKGKKHRVLVCPSCGVIATNPIVSAIKKIGKKADEYVESATFGLGNKSVIGLVADRLPDSKSHQKIENSHSYNSGYPLNQKVHDALK